MDLDNDRIRYKLTVRPSESRRRLGRVKLLGGVSHAGQLFISCSDHEPEVAGAVRRAGPDMTSCTAAVAGSGGSLIPVETRRTF